MSTDAPFTNRLSNETSPYLKQHAHNPVDWYPWGEEALQKSRELQRPIFLSIGYSACHWCHVMEHESFEDPEIGKILNDHFISIKVDREERPDLDSIYMSAVQLMTQSGGWPMSVFLTPELKPFYGGTYYPPDSRYGRPSFRQVLNAIIEAWKTKRDDLETQAAELTGHIQQFGLAEPVQDELGEDILHAAARQLSQIFDPVYGGFGSAPKFPHAMDIRLLLRIWKRFGSEDVLQMACKTLDGMALGGMYDHLGGGFHRYSTDRQWLAPHFEKMLYDNALLTGAYLEAYQATGEPFYREVVEATLAYVQREMTSPEGPFYSTQDADSEGEEGKFFVWSKEEVDEILGDDLSELFCSVYDVSSGGNWEDHNILRRTRSYAQDAKLMHIEEGELRRKLDAAKQKLLNARSQRIWPGRDEKVLTSWNGLMISAFAQAAQVLNNREYSETAEQAADFIWKTMRQSNGRLLRTYSAGTEPKLNGYLEDYTFLLDAFITLYEATFAPRWIEAALELTKVLIEQFWDEKEGGFFYTGKDHEQLIARTKDPLDSSIPSGNSTAVTALLRLAKLTGNNDLYDKAMKTLRVFSGMLTRSPQAAGQMLIGLDFDLGPVDEIVIAGDPNEADAQTVIEIIHKHYNPLRVLAFKSTTDDAPAPEQLAPLLAEKNAKTVSVYVCRDFACQAPLEGIDAIKTAFG